MRCSQCGGDTTIAGGRCTACGAPASTAFAATGLLTPPPEHWSVTQLPVDSAATIVSPPSATGGRPPTVVTPGLLAPGQAFGGRYQIIRVLGQGGMGCVYHAWDSELSVGVALKVIRPEINDDPAVAADIERRFKRELLLARQVSHKNVVRIHDLGDVDGTKYITMTYVEGSDLSAMLDREGKVPASRVIQYARQIAAGLQAAHDVGVVHRDLKPANVMVDAEGHALIMDFGIARSISSDSGVGTVLGTVVGTLDYMAPEQAQGQRADQRADIYAFGLILYDLLLGRRPAPRGESAVVALMARIKGAPPSPRSFDPAIPEALDAIVMKCLQPDPGARYQTSAELVAALDTIDDAGLPVPEKRLAGIPKLWLAAAALVFGAVVGIGTWWATRVPAPPVEREPVSVLIADFENLAKDPIFEGALEQALAIGIEGAPFISAYPRTDALRVMQQVVPDRRLDPEGARLLARREGIQVVLAGIIEPRDSGYRLSVRVIDPAPGTELARVERTAADKAGVLQSIAALTSDLRAALGDTTPESARLAAMEAFTAASLDAARDYSLALELASAGKDEEAIAHCRRALEHDPKFGRAYAAWAVSAYKLGRIDEATEAYNNAFQLLDRMTDREKHRTLGVYYNTVARNYEKAAETYSTLVQSYPADWGGRSNLALAHFYLLNFPKALEEGRAAVQLRPANATWRNNLALYAMYAGDFSTATAEATRVLEQDGTFHKAYLPIAIAALVGGDVGRARSAYERMAATGARGASLASAGLGDLAMYEGRFADGEAVLKDGIARDEATKSVAGMASKHTALAEAYHAQGRTALALQAARTALSLTKGESVRFPIAQMYLDAGRERDAAVLGAELEQQLQPQTRAYGKLIAGQVALRDNRGAEAFDAFREAQKLADIWIGRFIMGSAYVQTGRFAEALSELELCLKRQGEATAVFLDDVPTLRYFPPVYYWLGRAQEGLGLKAQATESYRAFLAARAAAAGDPLVQDARRRIGS